MTQRHLGAVFLVLLVNSAYLFARADASPFYFANVALHLGLGVFLVVAFVWLAPKQAAGRGPSYVFASALSLAAAALGLTVAVLGATRPHRQWLLAHIAVGAAAVVAFAYRWLVVERAIPAARVAGVVAVAALVLGGLGRLQATRASKEAHRIVNPATPPLTMDQEGAGPHGPFFPSSARTNVGGTIPSNFFMTSAECGRCHKDIYEQWRSSVHHFSSFNNQWYRKSIEYMQDVVGTKPSKWCAGCHDHAVFFNGRFDRPIREQIDTPEAQAGLGCTSCHSIVHVDSTMGQGDFTVEYPPLHDLAVSDNPLLRGAHDALLRLDPEPHRKTFLKSFHTEQTPEFCSSCHKVHLDVPVNAYRWIRGFNEYDNWQASAVSGEGARSFYYPPRPQTCAGCHMPLLDSKDPGARDGKIHSHRFPAANTAIPYVNRDAEQLRVTQNFLRAGHVTVDVFGLVRGGEASSGELAAAAPGEAALSSTFGQGEESMAFGAGPATTTPPLPVVAPLDLAKPNVRRGDSVRVDVVVRTRSVGHFFPGGTVDAFDVWVEFLAKDDRGRVLLHSGALEQDGRGPVEKNAHFYRSRMLDEHGNLINKRNAWMTRSVAYVRLIPPGAADTVRYRLRVPADCGDRITLEAKVNYRKFTWWNTQWAFAGVRDPEDRNPAIAPGFDDGRWVFTGDTSRVSGEIKAIPEIPITVVASARAELGVLPKGAPLPADAPVRDAAVRERWNDYGIGLLLAGDLKAAEAAFLEVTRMEPGYADGWVNVARARIQEGNMAGAEEMLREALGVDPKLAKSHFFLGTALKSLGRYDEALGHLREAARQYPRDRVVRNQIARVLFLMRRHREAVEEAKAVLAVDPEDLQAHYSLMLAYQGLGDAAAAERERGLYERFKADEAAQFVTGDYRRLHPEDNNERQSVHEHGDARAGSKPAAAPPKYAASAGGAR